MKKSFSKFRKSFAFVAALMLTAMLWSESASAQDALAESLMPPVDAISTLNAEIAVMDQQLQGTTNEPLEYKRKFYNGIVISLEQNNPVLDAINESYSMFVAAPTQTILQVPNPLSLATWKGYYDEVVLLLQD